MPTPQPGIFEEPAPHHLFLEYTLPLDGAGENLGPTLAAVAGAAEAREGVRLVMGFSGPLWAALSGGKPPAGLRPFRAIRGQNGKGVPATQNDLWLWLAGKGRDRVFAAGLGAQGALADVAALRLEQQGFTYLDKRDLTGFIDGTENPEGEEGREAGVIPAGADGEGGSYVIAMRWRHNLPAFHARPVAEQEKVIGRRKADSAALPEGERPETAHITRVEIEDEHGEELKIFRRSVPIGAVENHGLYFLAFSPSLERYDRMLARMYGLAGDGLEDRLTDFSRATSAAYYYAPPAEALNRSLGRG